MYTKIRAYVGLACKTFLKRKVHFFLSFSGILVGMITLTIVLTITEGNRIQIQRTMEAMGSDLIWVQFSTGITIQDAYKLTSFPEFETIAPINTTVAEYSNRRQTLIYGVDENYFKLKHYQVVTGRGLNKLDVLCQKQVAVVEGSYDRNWVDLSNEQYKVIGTVALKYTPDDTLQGSIVYVPLSLIHTPVYKIYIRPKNTTNILAKMKNVSSIVRLTYPSETFTVSCAEALINSSKRVNKLIMSLAFMLTLSILISGGVGIMNVLIISVKERTREIGLRKALGATRQDILLQFLIEGSLIAFWGGLIGSGLGLMCAYALSKTTTSLPIAINGVTLFISMLILKTSAKHDFFYFPFPKS